MRIVGWIGRLLGGLLCLAVISLCVCPALWPFALTDDPGSSGPFEDAVEYTGEAHPGTGIRYNGHGARAQTIVVIDAGHQNIGDTTREPVGPGADTTVGRVSYGTTGTFSRQREPALTLAVALYLRDELLSRGYSVVMVRETDDVDVGNTQRALMANEAGAAACIHLHANGWTDETMCGAMTICSSARTPYADAAACRADSRRLAETLLDAFTSEASGTGIARNGLREMDDKASLNWSTVPTCILEMGFMTNEHDDLLMASDAFRRAAAKSVADGLDAYFG